SAAAAASSSSALRDSAAASAGRALVTASAISASPRSMRWVIWSTSSRRSVHVWDTAVSTWVDEGRLPRGDGGKYVPARKGLRAVVAQTVLGQPLRPVID